MIDIYNTETMIAGLQLLPPKPVFLRNRYFPSDDTTIFATEDVLVDIKDEYQRKMAPCVIERKGGIMVGREGYKTDRIKPANVAPKRALTIDNIRKRQFGETLFSRRKPEEREAAILRQDLVELSDMIDQREEYMASKVLFENGYTMRHYADEYGGDKYEEFEVHFYEEDQNPSVYVPAAAWNAADDKWYQDLTAMVRSLKRRGVPVTDVLIGSSVANELMKRDSLGYAKPEEVKEIVSELYNLLGKENFVYYPPLHAKIIIVDDEYMFMGSHNWLSNAGKTEEKKRAIEGTIITTSSDSISYTKEELFS